MCPRKLPLKVVEPKQPKQGPDGGEEIRSSMRGLEAKLRELQAAQLRMETISMFPKIGVVGKPPKSCILIGVSIIFTIHFGGKNNIFGNTHLEFVDFFLEASVHNYPGRFLVCFFFVGRFGNMK